MTLQPETALVCVDEGVVDTDICQAATQQ